MIWLLVAPPVVLLLGAAWLARGLDGLVPMIGTRDEGAVERARSARTGLSEALVRFDTPDRDATAGGGDR